MDGVGSRWVDGVGSRGVDGVGSRWVRGVGGWGVDWDGEWETEVSRGLTLFLCSMSFLFCVQFVQNVT